MLKKAIITIKGDVQEAGYRAYIRKIAQKLNLEGYVENLPDGNVRIICEGEEEKIKNFCKEIKIKTLTVDIENIEIKYEKPGGKFKGKGFRVKVSDVGEEMFQGYATATKYFMIGFDKQDKMLDKQDKTLKAIKGVSKEVKGSREDIKKVGEEVKTVSDKIDISIKETKSFANQTNENFSNLKQETKSFANQTKEDFAFLKDRYHVISATMISYLEYQKKMEERQTKSMDRLTIAVENLTTVVNELVKRSEKDAKKT